jgi:hypothetical protein
MGKVQGGLAWSSFVDKAFWTLLVASIGFATNQVASLSTSIRELGNVVLVFKAATDVKIKGIEQRGEDHETRIRRLERRK